MSALHENDVRILIAEDSPTQAEQLRFLLEERGYNVTAAADGMQALAAARKEKPTLVISDVMMPELDGYGLCREIKADEALREIPVILLTSLGSPNDVIKGLECGADFFLRKPYDERHMLSRVDHVLCNRTLRASAGIRGDLEVVLSGQRHSINSGRQQILDLLISTYEEAVRINEELASSNRQLEIRNSEVERSSKFKDQFLSTMSHELRTPLNAVMGFSELLSDARYGPLNERQQRYVNHIHAGGQHLLQLINDILDLSQIEAGRLQLSLENAPVLANLAEVSNALQPLVDKKSQTLVLHASPELTVLADSTRLRQMLMNLLGNAIKFTPAGGKIELSARRAGEDVRIEVRDSGPGIPPEEQQRIFEAFHRLRQSDKAAEGTGLGLAITLSLVELHGGRLGLESEPGVGSCFYFTLPAVSTVRKEEVPRTVLEFGQVTPARILVIEDDLAAAYLLESQLASVGYEVVLCHEPQYAIERAIELQPAVITLDIVMRPVNGWDVLSRLKSDPRTARIPVVVVTVVDQRTTGALLGADEYIVKPVDRSALLSCMERCLNHRGQIGTEHSILVVEDHAPTNEFIVGLLTQNGYAVESAANGAEARMHVQTSLPKLVILDLLLPDVNGFRLIAEWRADSRTADLPIFVLTNKDLTQEEKDYLEANTGVLFRKYEPWRDTLVKHIQRVVPSEFKAKI
jgi:signal transduction histidine kinase